MIATDLARVNTEVKHRAEKERQTSRDIKKDVFSSYHERGTKKKFWVPMRNRTLDLRSYALMLYHWATETLRWKPQQPRSRYAWFVCLASFATLQMTQFSYGSNGLSFYWRKSKVNTYGCLYKKHLILVPFPTVISVEYTWDPCLGTRLNGFPSLNFIEKSYSGF